jgi:hypothetical protein
MQIFRKGQHWVVDRMTTIDIAMIRKRSDLNRRVSLRTRVPGVQSL